MKKLAVILFCAFLVPACKYYYFDRAPEADNAGVKKMLEAYPSFTGIYRTFDPDGKTDSSYNCIVLANFNPYQSPVLKPDVEDTMVYLYRIFENIKYYDVCFLENKIRLKRICIVDKKIFDLTSNGRRSIGYTKDSNSQNLQLYYAGDTLFRIHTRSGPAGYSCDTSTYGRISETKELLFFSIQDGKEMPKEFNLDSIDKNNLLTVIDHQLYWVQDDTSETRKQSESHTEEISHSVILSQIQLKQDSIIVKQFFNLDSTSDQIIDSIGIINDTRLKYDASKIANIFQSRLAGPVLGFVRINGLESLSVPSRSALQNNNILFSKLVIILALIGAIGSFRNQKRSPANN